MTAIREGSVGCNHVRITRPGVDQLMIYLPRIAKSRAFYL